MLSGDVTPAVEQVVATAIRSARAAGNITSMIYSIVLLGRLQMLQGRLRACAATYAVAAQAPRSEDLPHLVGSAPYYVGMAELWYEWNDLNTAERYLSHGMKLMQGTLSVIADTMAQGYLVLAHVRQARGDESGASAALDTFINLAQQQGFDTRIIAQASAARAQLWLAQGRIDAIHWVQTSGLSATDDLTYPREAEYLVLARALTIQGLSHPAGRALPDALTLLDRLLAAADAGGRIHSKIGMLIQRALVLHAQSNWAELLSTLEQALGLAAPEGYIRIFVDEGVPMATLLREAHQRGIVPDYTATLLAAFPDDDKVTRWQGDKIRAVHDQTVTLSPPHPVTPSLVEPLTTRELAVLRLLAAGASNVDIARELVVEQSTVKKHLIHIYGKLGVHSRTQAVARARALQLLD